MKNNGYLTGSLNNEWANFDNKYTTRYRDNFHVLRFIFEYASRRFLFSIICNIYHRRQPPAIGTTLFILCYISNIWSGNRFTYDGGHRWNSTITKFSLVLNFSLWLTNIIRKNTNKSVRFEVCFPSFFIQHSRMHVCLYICNTIWRINILVYIYFKCFTRTI